MEIDEYLDSSPIIDPPMNEVYKIPETKEMRSFHPQSLKFLLRN
jgi:hypothetical protein